MGRLVSTLLSKANLRSEERRRSLVEHPGDGSAVDDADFDHIHHL
jgi:hypothetical protein